jgi:hypothetical protein
MLRNFKTSKKYKRQFVFSSFAKKFFLIGNEPAYLTFILLPQSKRRRWESDGAK